MWQLLFRFFAESWWQARAFLVTFCHLNETSLDLLCSCVNISPQQQSFQWHQLDLHKSQFYNSRSRWAMFSNEHAWRMIGYTNYMKLTNGKLITQMLVKMSLFVTNKVFHEIIVWQHVDLHILHTVTAWQATVSTNTTWKFRFSEQM